MRQKTSKWTTLINPKSWKLAFLFILMLVLLLFSACGDKDMDIIAADESITDYLETALQELDDNHLKSGEEPAVKLHGEQQLGQLKLIAFTCREDSLGGLLLEELENGDHGILTCRVEDSIPKDHVTHVMFIHSYEEQNVACVINNGDAAKLTVFTGEGEQESFALDKPIPAAYLIDLDSIGSKESNEFSFQLEDKDGNILEAAEDNKFFTFSEDFSSAD